MGWPLSQDYNEAIQSPDRNFADSELRSGVVTTNALGIPQPCSGNFADVYQVRCHGGTRWAVKCFTREVPGLRERYQAICRHLRQARLPFSVDAYYLEGGIRVAGQWYPILKMQWVEGLTLNRFVERSADRPAVLGALLHIWGRMANQLRAAKVAHGDLQHGNVLLVPQANAIELKLVDYDGMWVPELCERPSGEAGHPAYQHPQRLSEQTYGPEVDRFPCLLTVTALRALQSGGRAMWDKYDNGDNLLFTQQDVEAPSKSRLFYELLKSKDAVVRRLAQYTVEALRNPLHQAPLLHELTPGPDIVVPRPSALPTVRAAQTEMSAPAPPVRVVAEGKAGSSPPAEQLEASGGETDRFGRVDAPPRTWWAAGIALGIALAIVLALAMLLYLATTTGTPRRHAQVDGGVIALGQTEDDAHG
jgi:hypothetical protein